MLLVDDNINAHNLSGEGSELYEFLKSKKPYLLSLPGFNDFVDSIISSDSNIPLCIPI
jgi:hypothetical protein